ASRPARITALCLDFLAPPGVHAGGTDPRRCPMRLLAPSLVVAALMASASAGHAQSAYDYPWCGVYTSAHGPGGAMRCYFPTNQHSRPTIHRLALHDALPILQRAPPR